MVLPQELASTAPEMGDLYRTIHAHPELGYEEYQTSALVASQLTKYGIEVKTGMAMTGVLGTLKGTVPGRTMLLRADMDALPVTEPEGCPFRSQVPGHMHACGHDGHVTMLLGAAHWLATHRDRFRGELRFCFQPAEEDSSEQKRQEAAARGYKGIGGAGFMVFDGAMDGVDGCSAIHVSPMYPTGTMFVNRTLAMASSDKFTAVIIGTGGHGAAPHLAVDPVSATAAYLDACHLLPAREVDTFAPCVVSIGTVETPGSVWNAIPERVVITGNIRTFDNLLRERLVRRLQQLLEGISASYRCTCEFHRMIGYSPVINNQAMAERAARVGSGLFGSDHVVLSDRPFMTSEDVGQYFSKAPGVLMWLGVNETGAEKGAPLHSPNFRLDPDALPLGAALHVNMALDFLNEQNS